MARKLFSCALVFACAAACGTTGNTPSPPPCDAICQDQTAVRALREMIKLAYNITLQGKPVGTYDVTVPCPLGGTARVDGSASSNAVQGSTFVSISYTFTDCSYLQRDPDPVQNFTMKITGTVTENGTIAIQPQTTTGLELKSDSMSMSGNVYQPPADFNADKCPVVLGQDGNVVSGTICGREVGVTL
jgi:hypothetical protein